MRYWVNHAKNRFLFDSDVQWPEPGLFLVLRSHGINDHFFTKHISSIQKGHEGRSRTDHRAS